MPKFSVHVALSSPDFRAVTFAPGDEVPEWAVGQVGEHCLMPDVAPAPDAQETEDAPVATPAAPDFTAPAPKRGRPRRAE